MTVPVSNIDTPSLGDRSYLVHDGKTAVAIDPQGDHGATGRPDLLGWESERELAGMQYQSSHLLANTFDDGTNLPHPRFWFFSWFAIPFRQNEFCRTGEIWVHCASGYRAAPVLGFIESAGRTPVLFNEDYAAAASASGLNVISNSHWCVLK